MLRYYFKYIPWLFIGFIICNIFADFEFMYTKKGKIVPGTYNETKLIVDRENKQLKFIGCNFIYINKKGNKIVIDDNDKIENKKCENCGRYHIWKKGKFTFKLNYDNEIKSVIYNKLKEGYVVYKHILLTNFALLIYTIIIMIVLSVICDSINRNNIRKNCGKPFISAGLYYCPAYNILCKKCCCKEEYAEVLKTKLTFMGYEQNKIDEYLNFIKSNPYNNYNVQRALKYKYNISSFKYYLKNEC